MSILIEIWGWHHKYPKKIQYSRFRLPFSHFEQFVSIETTLLQNTKGIFMLDQIYIVVHKQSLSSVFILVCITINNAWICIQIHIDHCIGLNQGKYVLLLARENDLRLIKFSQVLNESTSGQKLTESNTIQKIWSVYLINGIKWELIMSYTKDLLNRYERKTTR